MECWSEDGIGLWFEDEGWRLTAEALVTWQVRGGQCDPCSRAFGEQSHGSTPRARALRTSNLGRAVAGEVGGAEMVQPARNTPYQPSCVHRWSVTPPRGPRGHSSAPQASRESWRA